MARTAEKTSSEAGAHSDHRQVFQSFIDRLVVRRPHKLVLINPPQIPQEWFDPKIARLGRYHLYPPTGLLYIAAVHQETLPESTIKVVDLHYGMLRRAQDESFNYDDWKLDLAEALDNEPSCWVGVSCMFDHALQVTREIAAYVREHTPEATLLLGGVQASYNYEALLRDADFDIVIRREGELQYRALLRSAMERRAEQIPWGSVCRQSDGTLHAFDAVEEAVVPVDVSIVGLYELLEIDQYHNYGCLGTFSRYTGLDKPFCSVLSNRGCRARCTFCTVRNFNGFGVRGRSVESVVDEIKYLWHARGIRQIDWLDDDLLFDEGRALQLFKRLHDELPELVWICNNGLIAYAATDELLHWMVASGLRAFTIGIESGNSSMLTHIKKPATKPRLREAKVRFDRYPQVLATANFIIGFPGETFQEMLDTFEFAVELQLDWARFFICQPLRGTEMYSAFQAIGDERMDYRGSEDINPAKSVVDSTFLNPVKRPNAVDGEEVEQVRSGAEIFKIAPDSVPSQVQVKEIWFVFNLLANVLRNRNLSPSGNPAKLVQWVESIFSAYPFDASLAAMLAYGHRLLGDSKQGEFYDARFDSILSESTYWRGRLDQFPEIQRFVRRQPDVRREH